MTGGDWDTTNKELIREAQLRKAGGLDVQPPAEQPKTPNPEILAAETDSSGKGAPAAETTDKEDETAGATPPAQK
jgi:hypothetical protein